LNSQRREHEDLDLLRKEFKATNDQLVTAHQAEIEAMKDNLFARVAEQQTAHQNSIDELQEEAGRAAHKAREDLDAVREVVGLTQHTLEKAEEENRELMAKLEEATTNVAGGSDLEEKLKEALRKVSELQDELEGTKTVSCFDWKDELS
jgi:uncharacterized phage infection (PIP) family protein YhgE